MGSTDNQICLAMWLAERDNANGDFYLTDIVGTARYNAL